MSDATGCMQGIRAFFAPASVAVIGASTRPTKFGYAVLKNLVECGYLERGKVFPINLKAKEILGLPAYASILNVPEPVELALVIVPPQCAAQALDECGQHGVRAAVVISGGFGETGPEGQARECELMRLAQRYDMGLIGPNSLGVIDTQTPLNATFVAGAPPPGPVAFLSQSGALGAAILDWAEGTRLGLSKFVSLGNKAGLSEADLLPLLAADKATQVILMYCEELADGGRFVEAARQVSRVKPVVALKSGESGAGARAVASHTGSLAGSQQAYRAAFRQAGVLQAESLEALFDMGLALAYQPLPAGERIAVVSNAGGPGILAADAVERSGLHMARLAPATVQALRGRLPVAAACGNPVDVIGDASPERWRFALETVAADPNVDALLAVLAPHAILAAESLAHELVKLSDHTPKPVLACFMGEGRMRAAIEVLKAHGIPNYPFPERAARGFRALAGYRAVRARPQPPAVPLAVQQQVVRAVLEGARAAGRQALNEVESQPVLRAYGFELPRSELAETAGCAVEAAERLGYPVALKIASPDILHKTEVQGVQVGVGSAGEVRAAFDRLMQRAHTLQPRARLWGCLVQRMAPPGGLEVLVGVQRDPQFGPLVAFGLGGILVEALQDVTFRVAPFPAQEAARMLDELRGRVLLNGVRGRPPVDRSAIVEALLRAAQLALDFPEIESLDINPLLVYPRGALALDCRVMLKESCG